MTGSHTKTIRQQRASDLLYEELLILISSELSDPRLSFLDVVHVEISRDLRNANIFVFHQDEEVTKKDVLKGLKHATPFLRRQLARRCNFRIVPELLFYYDDMPGRAARIDELLHKATPQDSVDDIKETVDQSSKMQENSQGYEGSQ